MFVEDRQGCTGLADGDELFGPLQVGEVSVAYISCISIRNGTVVSYPENILRPNVRYRRHAGQSTPPCSI